jgi:hypothetical protein
VEGVDNHGDADFTIAAEPQFESEHRPQLLGGVTIIRGKTDSGDDFTAVPLYAWDNRLAGKMNVWLSQQGKDDSWCTAGWEKKLYKTYLPK